MHDLDHDPTLSCRQRANRETGVSLIEVLVTLLIVAIGLLGAFALQVKALRYNHEATLRTLAVAQAADMMDRIRANLAGVRAGAYDSLSGIPGSWTDCASGSCSPSQMAVYDQYEWNTANAAILPAGTGTVEGTLADGFTVTVLWADKELDGATDANCPGGTAADTRCFVTPVFKP
jgi:type IV pilus assembly protein PilV